MQSSAIACGAAGHVCREYESHLAQEFYHYNPARLPAPAEWVSVQGFGSPIRSITTLGSAIMPATVMLYSRPLQIAVKDVITKVQDNLLIACPFIRTTEADWLCNELVRKGIDSSVHLSVLTDIRAENVLNGALEMRALSTLAETLNNTVLVNLPRIHAKVYIADDRFALITSANLTSSGLDSNFEYGVGLKNARSVANVRSDLEAYARLGNVLRLSDLNELGQVAEELRIEFKKVQAATKSQLRSQFDAKLRAAHHEFLRAQVGNRSAHSLFADAILYILSQGPLPTTEIHPRVQRLLPDLCDDSQELIINGERFGKRWKHTVRNAQQFLKRENKIVFNGTVWMLSK